MDFRRLGAAFRAVRLHRGWRQVDVAKAAGVGSSTVSRAETSGIRSLQLSTLERIADALDIRVDILPRWRGGELDRILNAAHTAMHEQVAKILNRQPGWQFRPEVSFSVYGERGVIDIVAFHGASGALLVIELKTALVDLQGLITAVDRYVRLAPKVAADQGFRARHVSSWVILCGTPTTRRRVAAHATVLRAAFPADGRSMRRWLESPSAPIRCLSFLDPDATSRDRLGSRQRVRRRATP